MRMSIGAIVGIGLALLIVGGVVASVPGRYAEQAPRALNAEALPGDPPVVVLSRSEMLAALISSGFASNDSIAAPCPSDLQIDFAPDGSLVRTSGLAIYHREHPEIWILADGSCAVDPRAAGTKNAPLILR